MKKPFWCILTLIIASLFFSACIPPIIQKKATTTAYYATSDARKTSYYSTQTAAPSRTPGPSFTPGPLKTLLPKVKLICPECADIGININIWSTPSRKGVEGSVPHNTTVIVLETKTYNSVLYYKIQTQ